MQDVGLVLLSRGVQPLHRADVPKAASRPLRRRSCRTLDPMLSTARLQAAGEYVEWLRLAVHEKALPASNRVRSGASCLAISQEHHHLIVVLTEHELYASSFALLRVAFEAYVRGMWLVLCASETQVGQFLNGEERPNFGVLLGQPELTPGFSENVLSVLKKRHWAAMCAYTHTGGLHVQRWNTEEAVEPNYDAEEVKQVLFFAELIGSLAVLGIAEIAPRRAACSAGAGANEGSGGMRSNPSIERTCQRPFRALWPAAHVER